MRPENFDLLSGEYHRDKRDKEKERLSGIAEGKVMDADDNIKPWSASEAVKKAAFGPSTEPFYTSSASASTSASAVSTHHTHTLPLHPSTSFTPSVSTPTALHTSTSASVSAPIVAPVSAVSATIPTHTPHALQTISPTSTAIPASLPPSNPLSTSTSIPPSTSPSSGRPPTVPSHHTPALVPPAADILHKGALSGIAGIAEVSNRSKASHVPFDGTLPPLGNPDSDPSVAESEDEHSPHEIPYRRKWGSKTDGGDTSDREGSEKEVAISMEGDATLREWMKTAQVT